MECVDSNTTNGFLMKCYPGTVSPRVGARIATTDMESENDWAASHLVRMRG